MIDISMQTGLIIYSLCFLIGFLFTMYYYIVIEEQKTEHLHFVMFYLLGFIGSLLIVFREDLNLFFSIIIANLLIYISYIMLIIGSNRMLGKRILKKVHIVLILLFLILFFYFTYIDFETVYRVYIFNFGVIALILIELVRDFYTKRIRKELMSLVFGFIVILTLVRLVNMMINTESSNAFLEFQVDSLFVVIIGLANLLTLTGFLSLVNSKHTEVITENERSKTSLLSNLPGFAYRCLYDEFWTMKFLSSSFEAVTGYKNEEVIENRERSFESIIDIDFQSKIRAVWDQVIEEKSRFAVEYKINHKTRGSIWILEQGVGVYDENGDCIAIEGYIMDIDESKKLKTDLEFLSYRDFLTGLYNRRYFEGELKKIQENDVIPLSLIMGDLNGLKFVNDSFGHDYGDEIIKTTAKIINETVPNDALVSRLGGDEFIVALQNYSEEKTKEIVNEIQKNIKKTAYKDIGLSISLGYAIKMKKNQDINAILKEAEDMMYRQKVYESPSLRRKAVDAVLGTLFEKDKESESHSRNVSRYSKILAKAAGLSQADIKKTETAGLLHDVGKIIISEDTLKSTSRLSSLQYEEIKKHPEIGYRILNNVDEFKDLANIILCHHERIDGSGYPNGIKGEEIPYISRIITICDAYDAMVHDRRYRKKISKKAAIEELIKCSNTQFDKDLVELFIKAIS